MRCGIVDSTLIDSGLHTVATSDEVMALTQQIAVLNAAIRQGEKIVKLGDKLVEYRSPEALIIARDDALRALSSITTVKSRLIYHTQTGRGLR